MCTSFADHKYSAYGSLIPWFANFSIRAVETNKKAIMVHNRIYFGTQYALEKYKTQIKHHRYIIDMVTQHITHGKLANTPNFWFFDRGSNWKDYYRIIAPSFNSTFDRVSLKHRNTQIFEGRGALNIESAWLYVWNIMPPLHETFPSTTSILMEHRNLMEFTR